MKPYENRQILDAFYTEPNNLVDLFERSASKWGDRHLFGTKNSTSDQYEWVTYRQVAERINHLRGGLAKIGMKKGDRVGIIVSNCTEWFICENATHGLNGIFVPMYEKELPKTWQYIITDSAIKYLFVRDKAIFDIIAGMKAAFPLLEKIFIIFGDGENSMSALEAAGKSDPVASIKPKWHETSFIIYTSGTTGNPKGVMLHHGNLTHAAQGGVENFFLTEKMRVVSILPWAHTFGLTGDLHTYICCGGAIAFAESLEKLMKNFQEVKPTGLSAVPRVFNKIYDTIHQSIEREGGVKKQFFDAAIAEALNNRDKIVKTKEFNDYDKIVFERIRELFGGQLKLVVTGGAIMKTEIALFFKDVGMPTFDCYGLTETAPSICMNSPLMGNRYGSVGKVVRDMRVVIDKSQVDPDSQDGEIIVYGANIMQGYHNKPNETEAVMMPGTWKGFPGLRTGDRGWIDRDGYLHITGRFKEEYKLENGKYIHPVAIENEIKLVRYVANVIIYGEGKQFNAAIVVPDFVMLKSDPATASWSQGSPYEIVSKNELTDFLTQEIITRLKQSFGEYEIPKKYLFVTEDFTVENGMLTQTLKLVRKKVINHYRDKLKKLYQE